MSIVTRVKAPKQSTLFDIWEHKEGDTFEEGWKNKLIWGDNLLVMGSLLEKFAGKVDLIYIDPPFATGADFSFKTQIGDDDLEVTKKQSIIEEKAYRDTWGNGNSSYLAMMWDRLILLRDLLSPIGTIYIHTDWTIGHYLKPVLDEIFGLDSFRNEITWFYTNKLGTGGNTFDKHHDSLFVYVKGQRWKHNPLFRPVKNQKMQPVTKKIDGERVWLRDEHGNRIYEMGKAKTKVGDVWEVPYINPVAAERLGYATQKPEALLENVITASRGIGDLIADFFCGSGTTLAVAEKLGRRWIGCDLGRFAIHTTRKRLLEIENCKPFEILNLGKYERQYWQGVTFGEQGIHVTEQALYDYLAFMLKLYGTQPVAGLTHLHGKKGKAMVHIGAVDAPVTIDEIDTAIAECVQCRQTELHVLGWEWEMGLHDLMIPEAKKRGVKLLLLQIPREVMEQQAVDKGDIQFFELAYLEVDIQTPRKLTTVTLKDFVIPNTELIPEEVRTKVKKWSDYIDYWAVDWDFQDDTFMQGWVTYRTRKDRTLALTSDPHTYEEPGRYRVFVKVVDIFGNDTSPNGWREDTSGRRPSRLLLIQKLRAAVDHWRDTGYPGASDVTQRLFAYWFEEDHAVAGFPVPFRYHFCQREAIETLAYVVEVARHRDAKALIDTYAEVFQKDLLSRSIEFQTTMDGRRQIRRYVPELNAEGVQELPPEGLQRYAFKMATGSGKTWVMAMAIVWSHFHKQRVPGSDLSTNFLIVAPNIIVYERLKKDFDSNHIFHALPLIPPEWRGTWRQKVVLRGESTEPDPAGTLFLTNTQQLYETHEQHWTPENAIEAILGPRPRPDLASYQRSMLEHLKELPDLVVLNDEAHHVHDTDLAWSQSLLGIHRALPKGLALWLDFSATPKDQHGMYFPWTVCDYPLAQVVEDRIVKAPIIATNEDDAEQPIQDPDDVTRENVCEKYGYWLRAAVQRWQDHFQTFRLLGTQPVLFIMAEKNTYADAIGAYLWKTEEFGFKKSEVLVIHTDQTGEIIQKDLDAARQAARDIDQPGSPIKAIVSVMMLREGWDVHNVSVVLGLRPFTAKAEILPEQVIGRGLRLMTDIGPDRTQTLEVIGTRNLLNVLRDQLEAEGVGVATTTSEPPQPVIIAPMQDRLAYDIAIPLTKPRLIHNDRKLSTLDPAAFEAIYGQTELEETFRINLKLEFATTETEVHQADLAAGAVPIAQELLRSITNKVLQRARLPMAFAKLFPLVRTYVATRCFGKVVDLDCETVRTHLRRLELQEGIARYLARKIAALTVETRTIEFDKADFQLSDTRPFSWRRNLPPLVADRTVFNYVATYNDFERRFAQFLEAAPDVLRFASLGTTEQGESGTLFRIDYLKPSGAIGFYYPDWVAVQMTEQGEVNWIIETKGRVWEDTAVKDAAMREWCTRISQQTTQRWEYARVNQSAFEAYKPRTLVDATQMSGQESGNMTL